VALSSLLDGRIRQYHRRAYHRPRHAVLQVRTHLLPAV